jgi:lipid A 3-O-deacylase
MKIIKGFVLLSIFSKYSLYVHVILLTIFISAILNPVAVAEDFFLDSPKNSGTLRFEIDNDIIWSRDSNFTNGWSLQYHTKRYASWDETNAPGIVKWIGNRFPTLCDEDSIVRIGQGIGQNMITPGDLTVEVPQEGDVPYAGTLTYTINWQSFNRYKGKNFQVSLGVLGPESMAEEFQKFVHDDLGIGESPQGWNTQRDTEPIINLGYEHSWRVGHIGNYLNDWGGQFTVTPSAALGNLMTAMEVGLALRYGWNILEGFNTYPAPPGRGFFQASHLPKPPSASPHGFEAVLGGRACYLIYSVIYDGSLITDDTRSVDRNDFIFVGGFGLFYHYYKLFSIRATFQTSTDLLVEESIPDPEQGGTKTSANVSYGSFIVDFYF